MSAVLYPKFKEKILQAVLDLSTVNIKALLVDTGAYTYSASHEFLSDITAGARIAASGNLATKTFTAGVFDADDVTFASATGTSCEAVVLYVDTGTAGTSRLISYSDAYSGLPITPNGQDITLAWDNGASKIFAL